MFYGCGHIHVDKSTAAQGTIISEAESMHDGDVAASLGKFIRLWVLSIPEVLNFTWRLQAHLHRAKRNVVF